MVLVHGFTQTGASWRHVVDRLAPRHTVVTVDAPGHGGSTGVEADLTLGAELLGRAGGPATYVGYSMGGRLALRLAIDRPDLVRSLVLIGATAGIDDPEERARRRRSDEALADRIEAIGVARFLDEWLAQDLFSGLPDDPDERQARLTNTAAGLASSLRLAGTGTMDPPWWDELSGIAAPTLVLAGEHDRKFTVLGARLAEAIGADAEFEAVPGAGHAAHLHAPERVSRLIAAHAARS
jgi:2-succinyl-6-hydroxy-2,4-cyclohexadiene-1-carboxylate synthase